MLEVLKEILVKIVIIASAFMFVILAKELVIKVDTGASIFYYQ